MKAPVVILVEPQLAENIGMTARAMANFGLSELRLVAPRNGWPKKGVREAASGATHVLDGATVHATLPEAIADLNVLFATTARERGQMKRVLLPDLAMADAVERIGHSEKVGVMFGRERVGLLNDEVSLADAIVTFPVTRGISVAEPRPGRVAGGLRMAPRRRPRPPALHRRDPGAASRPRGTALAVRNPGGDARRRGFLSAREARDHRAQHARPAPPHEPDRAGRADLPRRAEGIGARCQAPAGRNSA